MPIDIPPNNEREIYDVKTLSAQSKVRVLLEIFDLAKDDKVKDRKEQFMDLVRQYFEASTVARIEIQVGRDLNYMNRKKSEADSSGKRKAELHNQIMDVITKMSLSQGLTKSQRELATYLAGDRKNVENMIRGYYLSDNSSDLSQNDELHRALRGDASFKAPPGREE